MFMFRSIFYRQRYVFVFSCFARLFHIANDMKMTICRLVGGNHNAGSEEGHGREACSPAVVAVENVTNTH